MTYRLNTDKTAAVALSTYYLPIDENTPLGVRIILIDRAQGVAHIRTHHKGDGFTHWHALPGFKD